MDIIMEVMSTIDYMLETETRQHIIGGALLSASIFFGGLAFTIMTMSSRKNRKENKNEQ